jgi:microcystin degradation protein MlrC
MRIFSASFATETNTFAPMSAGMASFKERGYFAAGQHPDQMQFFAAPLWAARQRGAQRGWTLIEGMVAAAQPSGVIPRLVYEALRDELLADLRAALPVDVVLLGLHGAMVAQGYDDCEGDLLERVRAIVGARVVIGAELDPHSHVSERMVSCANLLIAFKEYPHTDALERGFELVDLCVAMAEGKIRPVAALADAHMISVIHTTREPGRGLVDRAQALEGQGGVLSISLIHGFPWGDVPDMGSKVLVYTDGDAASAQLLARRLADELFELREQMVKPYPGIDAALDEALAFDGGPVVLADSADNAGGGAASDSTFMLRRLIERGIVNAALGPLWDPLAVRIATEAGVGAELLLRIGGKVGPMSGDPIDLLCSVKALKADMHMSGLGTLQALGDCALVEANGVHIVLNSVRGQAMGTDMFTQLGCELGERKMIVVKSSQHFYASYAKVAKHVIYVDAPGTVTTDLKSLPYRKIQRPKWPL